jgi:hypothetical protein
LYDGIDKVFFESGGARRGFVIVMLYMILRVLGLWPNDSILLSSKQTVCDVLTFFWGLQFCYYFFKSNTLPIWVYFFLAVVFGVGLVLLCERFNKKE